MGWCHEFGSQIQEGCDHPMTAGEEACSCEACGVSCPGRFAGCATVWARGPRELRLSRPAPATPVPGSAAPAPSAPSTARASGSRSGGKARTRPAVVAEPDPGAEPDAAKAPASSPTGNGHANVAMDDGRAEILEWLRSTFDGVRSDIRALTDAVSRQQATLASFDEASQSNALVVAATEALPARVGAAVAEALESHHADTLVPAQDEVVAKVSDTLAGVENIASELRNELVRLHAFREALAADLPAVAAAVDQASSRAEARLAELTERVDELAARKSLSGLVRGLSGPPRRDA